MTRTTIGTKIDREFHCNFRFMISMGFGQIGVYHYFLGGNNAPAPEEQFQVVTRILDDVGFNKQKNLFAIAVQTDKFYMIS